MSAVADNEAITYNDVPFTMAFESDLQEMGVSTGGFVAYGVKLVEVV